jgi:DHA1 family multidrug resistance protein-like MFS transporter
MIFVAGLMVMIGVHEEFKPKKSVDAGVIKFLSEWRRILSAPGVTIIYSMRFLSAMGRMMIVPIMPIFILTLLTKGAAVNTFTGLVVGIASAATTVSAVALGRLGDRIGHRRIVIISILMGALFYLPQGWVSAAWQLLILQALVGVAMGGIMPGLSALLTNYTKRGEEGAAFGLDNSITAAGKTAAPLLGSAVAIWFGLRSTFTATALLFLLAGLLAAWLLPHNRIRNSDSSLVN